VRIDIFLILILIFTVISYHKTGLMGSKLIQRKQNNQYKLWVTIYTDNPLVEVIQYLLLETELLLTKFPHRFRSRISMPLKSSSNLHL